MTIAAGLIAANLALFIGVVSTPAFQELHHHWIFPILAGLLAGQWALTPLAPRASRRTARATLVSAIAFVLIMGIVRHATILACFDRCAFKLSLAALLAAPVFLLQARLDEPGFWSRDRALLAGLGAGSWSLYLALRGAQLAPWAIEAALVAAAAVLWLGRSRAAFLVCSLGILGALLVRALANEYAVIALGVLWGAALPLALVGPLQRRLDLRAARPSPPPALAWRLVASAARIAAVVAFVVAVYRKAAGPVDTVLDPAKRQAYLIAMAPKKPPQDPRTLSPLARALRAHVVFLAKTVGVREAQDPARQKRARDYVAAQLRAMGYVPKLLPYESKWLGGVRDGTTFWNVEARLGRGPADLGAEWILGAHYDSTSTTPGADDNASGVAVLLEAARLLRSGKPARAIRFVGFGTEEPPAFGTRNMGSWHYARSLRESDARVHGMISLEMLGCFNDRPGSQLYPPFLQNFFPDRGDFVGIVGDARSRGLAGDFAAAWRHGSPFPLTTAVLPGPLSSLALSDQLNFWAEGFPALMLSDTAFYRNPRYHELSDTPETLDYERMAAVTRSLARTLELDPAR